MTVSASRFARMLLILALAPPAALAGSDPIDRFDALVARLAPTDGAPSPSPRQKRAPEDFVVERRLSIAVEFPGSDKAIMYAGLLHGEPAVFTRSGHRLDATVMRDGEIEVTSFETRPSSTAQVRSGRPPRSVRPGHFEDPAAYSLHVRFLKHDDLAARSLWDVHARYVAWWIADLANHVLPVEPIAISYAERIPWLTDMAYGGAESLDAFEHALATVGEQHGFTTEETYKEKYVLLTAHRPMPGTTGVAFEGGNEAIASVMGRHRIVAHEVGHMLGATHENAETRGWWGCETNMLAKTSSFRSDCMEYSADNQRAVRSYMRHGPDALVPRRLVDAPAAE